MEPYDDLYFVRVLLSKFSGLLIDSLEDNIEWKRENWDSVVK